MEIINRPELRILTDGVMRMKKDRRSVNSRDDGKPNLRLEPEKRMCPIFDPDSIAKFPVAAPGEMGFRVLDNFCEEHIE